MTLTPCIVEMKSTDIHSGLQIFLITGDERVPTVNKNQDFRECLPPPSAGQGADAGHHFACMTSRVSFHFQVPLLLRL